MKVKFANAVVPIQRIRKGVVVSDGCDNFYHVEAFRQVLCGFADMVVSSAELHHDFLSTELIWLDS